jgi:ribosomal protein S18 acetylase RimI-like enzyme
MTDSEGVGCLQQIPTVFDAREHLLSACSLLPLTADMALAVANQLTRLDPWLTLGYRPESLAHYLQRADVSLHKFLVSASGQIVGVVCCRYPWLFGPFLELLAVYPQFQGQGFGREILDWLENPVAFANIWTTVSAFNISALNFYTKCGFQEAGLLTDLVRAGFDEILLRKTVPKI